MSTDIPSSPAFTDGDAQNLGQLIGKLQKLREIVEIITGKTTKTSKRPIWEIEGGGGGSGSGGTTIVSGGGSGGGSTDLTPPPTPTGFTAGAAISHIFVQCDNQTYTVGGGHLYSRVYGATYDPVVGGPLPTFANATLIDTFSGTIEAIAENPATEWHLWLTWVTTALVESVAPAGGTNGVTVTTAQDVSSLIKALTGEITQDQLFSTLSARINLIDAAAAVPGSVNARVATETSARIGADATLASNISTVAASAAAAAAAVVTESTARANADTALGTQITTVQAQAVANGGTNIITNPNFVPASLGWISGVALLARTAGGVPAGAPSDYVARLSGSDGLMTPVGTTSGLGYLPVRPGEILDCSIWIASGTATINRAGLLAHSYNAAKTDIAVYPNLGVSAPGVTGWVQLTATYTVPAGTFYIVPMVWIEQASSGGPDTVYYSQPTIMRRSGSGSIISAAVQTESQARASADGSLFAQYTVKLDVNGYVSGFGLTSTSSGAAPFSTFIIRADSFSIASPSGPSPVAPSIPFIVRTTATTINGQSVPPGVYIKDAFIQNGTIVHAMIGLAEIDDALIANLSASKLVAGSIAVGQYIQSTNFVTGTSGWRIDGNGFAEFAAAAIRGTLNASQIGAGTIDASKLNVTTLSAITANIGTLRTASSGQRMEISDNRIRVYDASNVLRVKIGDLS